MRGYSQLNDEGPKKTWIDWVILLVQICVALGILALFMVVSVFTIKTHHLVEDPTSGLMGIHYDVNEMYININGTLVVPGWELYLVPITRRFNDMVDAMSDDDITKEKEKTTTKKNNLLPRQTASPGDDGNGIGYVFSLFLAQYTEDIAFLKASLDQAHVKLNDIQTCCSNLNTNVDTRGQEIVDSVLLHDMQIKTRLDDILFDVSEAFVVTNGMIVEESTTVQNKIDAHDLNEAERFTALLFEMSSAFSATNGLVATESTEIQTRIDVHDTTMTVLLANMTNLLLSNITVNSNLIDEHVITTLSTINSMWMALGAELANVEDTCSATELNILNEISNNTERIVALFEDICLEPEGNFDIHDWPIAGYSSLNQMNTFASSITKENIDDLTIHCDLPNAEIYEGTGPGGNGYPLVYGNYVYFSGLNNGILYCYNRFSCELVWKKNLAMILEAHVPDSGIINATEETSVPSRTSSGIYKTPLGASGILVGLPSTRIGPGFAPFLVETPTYVISLSTETGQFQWSTKISEQNQTAFPEDFMSHITGPITTDADGSHAYVSTATYANVFTAFGIPCTHIGKVVRIDLSTGQKTWEFKTLPTGEGAGSWCGASVWERMAVSDELGLLFFGTGNGQYHPQDIEDCFSSFGSNISGAMTQCLLYAESLYGYGTVLIDAVVALNITTGELVWKDQPQGIESFGFGCPTFGNNPRVEIASVPGTGCPGFMGPDWDMSGAAVLSKEHGEYQVTISSKGGLIYNYHAATGVRRWSIDIGTGSLLGGTHWGGSYSPETGLYYNAATGAPVYRVETPFTGFGPGVDDAYINTHYLVDGTAVCGGAIIFAIDVWSGQLIWQSRDPWALNSVDETILDLTSAGCFEYKQPAVQAYSMDRFKSTYGIPTVDDLYPVESEIALTRIIQGSPCPRSTIVPGLNESLLIPYNARVHGAITVVSSGGFVIVPSMTGNLYLLDSATGDCLGELGCNAGVYGSATVSGDQILVMCGYANFIDPAWQTTQFSNATRIFSL